MKKTLLATTILAGLVSASTQAATVYDKDGATLKIGGRAELRADFIDNDEGTVSDLSRARIHFDGETKISENLTGFGFMEYQIEPGGTANNRYLYAGFGTQVGNFSYGRQDTASVLISDMTDIATTHSGIQQIINASSERQDTTFAYSNSFAKALTVQASYSASNLDEGDSFSVSGLYALDYGLSLGASYSDSELDETQSTLGAAYTLNNLYVAVTYAIGDLNDDDDFNSLEAAIQYKFTKELRLIGIIAQQEQVDTDTVDFYAVEAQYRFNESIRTSVAYAFNNLDGNNIDDSLVASIRYNF